MSATYMIIVSDEGFTVTGTEDGKPGVDKYLRSWADLENLTVQVQDENGRNVGHKPQGAKTIVWSI